MDGASRKRMKMQHQQTHVELSEMLQKLLKGLDGQLSASQFHKLQELTSSMDSETRWLAIQCVGIILQLGDVDKERQRIRFNITNEEDAKFGLNFHLNFEREVTSSSDLAIDLPDLPKSVFKSAPGSNDLSLSIRKLNIQNESKDSTQIEYIILDSFNKIMKEIAYDVSAPYLIPICIVGSTGTGKTTIINLTASLFKRNKYPDIITVQMSDQIDSRLLLGSYHSTDLPGQFVWKPGCLTKAVLNGHWIVLEDLDSASSDVTTLFDSLIDTGTLSVPGYGEIKKFHKNFRLFSTCRTFGGSSDKRALEKIGRHWKKLKLDSFTPMDLKILLVSLYPHLRTIAERLSTIFTVMEEAKMGKRTKNRLLSLRDFFKLCRRIPTQLDFTQCSSALKIFKEAYDLFIASLYDPDSRLDIAELLGTHLNILKTSTDFFSHTHKPIVSIDLNNRTLSAGRYTLPMYPHGQIHFEKDKSAPVFSLTKRACSLLEMICGAVQQNEPVLLLGETGVGKTSCVQFLAQVLCQKLVVVNLNRQSDSSDLLGGYKPVELKYIFGPLREEFETLFIQTFSRDTNRKFLDHIMTCFANRQWKTLIKLMIHVQKSAIERQQKFKDKKETFKRWTHLGHQLSRIETQLEHVHESPFAFSFIEGTLIDAIRKGYWILLDEINLASPEMLQCLSGVLESQAQIHLWEKGNEAPIDRHSNFHLFAAMNPSTDIGKKDLSLGLRNRFTEFFVDELTEADELQVLVSDYLREMSLSTEQLRNIVKFYLTVKKQAQTELVDGTGKKPHFSLRTLCRALKISAQNLYGSIARSLYESFCISFLTQLDYSSHPIVQNLIAKHIFLNQNLKAILNHSVPKPTTGDYVFVEGYWISKGDLDELKPEKYILTPSIRRNLKDIARIVSAGKLPILIQGETSVGKTSLIQYLAQLTGNRCYRINNHQHTDLQEYIGSYQSDDRGKLVFTEGVLVQAMRRGEWIILDELNLAPSEVLEALNRLLDDNRQLFITETGVTVTANPRFTLFATQNPPGLYGGRKLLSRAFRNRFVELHFDEIPSKELETILHLRCSIPPSYCKKIIGVLKDLQMRRKASAALQGKHGFATLRDLFRWAERYRLSDPQSTKFHDWDQHLADDGYLVLAGKVRQESEGEIIREVIKHNFKRTVLLDNLFSLHENTSTATREILEKLKTMLQDCGEEFAHIVWTFQMRRLAVLIGNAMKFQEPVLLVGETGCGKTTVVQLLCQIFKRKLFSVNCHMHSESSDFLGGLRPVRNRDDNNERLFEWVNGPLVEAMEQGGIFLADEISLADDSVLERLNSVLEPERTLLISEKGDETPMLITAHEHFQFVGTMNPGGDYGKKELSPALRNRLTEIWCPVSSSESDLCEIIEHNLQSNLKDRGLSKILLGFCNWLKRHELLSRCTVSIRDLLAWVNFVNIITEKRGLNTASAVHHGACLTFLDGLGSGNTSTGNSEIWRTAKTEALNQLLNLISSVESSIEGMDVSEVGDFVVNTMDEFGIGKFTIRKKHINVRTEQQVGFTIRAPTTYQNGIRILRAMQLQKPILLEGSPGVGKTAMVTALGKFSHHDVVRINLSEQTDISDLFGADLPVEGETGGHFAWRDGPLLQALKDGAWILLDELNLASQSVLEGLNACLDHRGEVFVPELNRTFKIGDGGKTSRIFACQNPVRQGGARKGLPKSFLNRFTQVFMDPLGLNDLNFVIQASFPGLPYNNCIELMTRFSDMLNKSICVSGTFGLKGAPWDFNLRDLTRWAQLVYQDGRENDVDSFKPDLFVDVIYGLRMRCSEDRVKLLQLFNLCKMQQQGLEVEESLVNNTSENLPLRCGQSELLICEDKIICGKSILERNNDILNSDGNLKFHKLLALHPQLEAIEGLMKCLQMVWMPILVGPSGCGKSSLVKLIAQLCGRDLQIMTPSPEMDTIELLGGFEQADIYRKIGEVTMELSDLMTDLARCLTVQHNEEQNGYSTMETVKGDDESTHFFDSWWLIKNIEHLAPQDGLGQDDELKRIEERVGTLQSAYSTCKCLMESSSRLISSSISSCPPGTLPSSWTRIEEQSDRVWRELQDIYTHLKAGIQTGGFHWIHSLLIKAVIKGDWLLIDGANRCTAAVLDRLNSLMEPNGSLLLSERGTIDGEIVEIQPHPNFRLILAMNPGYGEISRAMRNRGVEIYISRPNEKLHAVAAAELEMNHSLSSTISQFDQKEEGSSRESFPLSLDNFLHCRWYRIWKSLEILSSLSSRPQGRMKELLREIGVSEESKSMLERCLTVSVFSRTLKEDTEALNLSVTNKFPELSMLASKLALLNMTHNSHNEKRDLQWEPHFIAKYGNEQVLDSLLMSDLLSVAKLSLNLHKIIILREDRLVEFNGSKMLGFIAKNISDGTSAILKEFEQTADLLTTFWFVWKDLNLICEIMLNCQNNSNWQVMTSLNVEQIASIWLKGLKIFVWIQRMNELLRTELTPKKNNEILFANLTLILEWVLEDIMPTLNEISIPNSNDFVKIRERLENTIKKMIKLEGGEKMTHGKMEKSLREGYFDTNSLAVGKNSQNEISTVLKFVFDFWSSKSLMPTENWPQFLTSLNGKLLYLEVTRICENIAREELCQPGDLIEQFKSEFCIEQEGRPISMNDTCIENLQVNLCALNEFLRLTKRDKISTTSSTFTNPWFTILNQRGDSSTLGKYFDWEEKTRFGTLFVDFPLGYLDNYTLLPYFTARMLIDTDKANYRSYSLGSKEETTRCFETVKNILSKESFVEAPLSTKDNLKGLVRQFEEEIFTVSQCFGDMGLKEEEEQLNLIVSHIDEGDDVNLKMMNVGMKMVQFSGILMTILSTLPPVDPAVKKRILADYLSKDIEFFKIWQAAHKIHQLQLTGQEGQHLCHPYKSSVARALVDTEVCLEATSRRIADRPSPPLYNALLTDIKLFVDTLASPGKLETICKQSMAAFEKSSLSVETLDQVLISCRNWIEGYKNFVTKMTRQFWYWDIVTPILSASSWAAIGIDLMIDALMQKFRRPFDVITKSLDCLVSFPMSQSDIPIQTLQSELLIPDKVAKRLFLSSAMSLANEIETRGCLNHASLSKFFGLANSFREAWIQQQDAIRQKKADEDALYIYKGKERVLDVTEEEQEIMDIKETFPNYDAAFHDLKAEEMDLNDSIIHNTTEETNNLTSLDDKDVGDFMKIVGKVVARVATHWIYQSGLKSGAASLDFVEPFLNRFQVGCFGYEKLASVLGHDDEQSYALGAQFALSKMSSNWSNLRGEHIAYDIYRDPNIPEVESLQPILIGMRKRVMELLQEWPDYPCLKKLIIIIERIESFPMDSPLIKFVTGLELLMETAQEWESNAHAGVSIAISMSEITQLIIRWRKKELSSWKHLLDMQFQKEQMEGWKWWFHITASMLEMTTKKANEEPNKPQELLTALQQFIESSPLGQYESRLNLLYQIHCYVVALEKYLVIPSIPESVHKVVWSAIKFYEEFRSPVSSHLANLRSPIEKKMKDFVKICRWNDMNHSSVKDSVLKSHKTLSKLIRDFKTVLAIPARTLLISDCNIPQKCPQMTMMMGNGFGKRFILEKNLENRVEFASEFLGERVVTDLPVKSVVKVYKKLQELSKDFVENGLSQHAENSEVLNNLLDSAIESTKDLQDLQIEVKGEQRKKFLHHVHSRRRLSLADLFKNLASILNLSYRRGLMHIQNSQYGNPNSSASTSVFQDFVVQPHDLSAGWKQLVECKTEIPSSADNFLVKLWSSECDPIFQKCVIRLISMMKAFESPNKQLSVAIVERCKGFAVALMSQVSNQKGQVAQFSKFLWIVRTLLNSQFLTQKDQETMDNGTVGLTEKLYNKLSELESQLVQWKLLLSDRTVADEQVSNSKMTLLTFCENLLGKILGVKTTLRPFVVVKNGASKEILLKGCETLSTICTAFDQSGMSSNFTLLYQRFQSTTITELNYLIKEIESKVIEVPKKPSLSNAEKNDVIDRFSALLKNIMVTFQKLDDIITQVKQDKEKDTTDSILTKIGFNQEMGCFNIETLTQELRSIVTQYSNFDDFTKILNSFKPLISQYLLLGQFYLSELLWCHREHCQLLVVLCCLFTTLGQKGFCLPPDYEDEAAKEGSELDAKGGLGLGEGETTSDAMDVSDRIESEDQLEETLKPGESLDPADKDVDNDDKGIEMNDDFEGKLQDEGKDKKKEEGDDKDESENEDEGEKMEHDKQMGDVDDPDADKLDEQLWGGSSDEEDDEQEEIDDMGGKRQNQGEPELKAKDPRLEEEDDDDENENPPNQDQDKEKPMKEHEDDPEEINDDQIDPYHGENQPDIEPEALDLPEDLHLDDGDMKDNEDQEEENPFDLDKEQLDKMEEIPEGEEDNNEKDAEIENEQKEMDKEDNNEEDGGEVNVENDMEVDEPIIEEQNQGKEYESVEQVDEEEVEKPGEESTEIPKDKINETEEDPKKEMENIEGSEELKNQVDQNVQGNDLTSQEDASVTVEEQQPNQADETGTGQAESKTGQGHDGKMFKKEQQQQMSREDENDKESSKKPSDMDRKRTLANDNVDSAKRLKTLENPEEENNMESAELDDSSKTENADMYQHITEGEKHDTITLDNASKEEAERQQVKEIKDNKETGEENPSLEEDDDPVQLVEDQQPDLLCGLPNLNKEELKKKRKEKNDETEQESEKMEVDGENVLTFGASRPTHSTIHTVMENMIESTRNRKISENIIDLDSDDSNDIGDKTRESIEFSSEAGALAKWHELENVTLPLAQELCEQLRLILEPTLAARLRGDYKTGKRLNMRKVIPYVASGFRKDKIWLRRTQPSKREYQILLALDDSASMSDNQSKQMAFSAVAVVAKSLGLLEAGQLSVISFGEKIDLMHSFDDPFTDVSGAYLLEKFTFAQRQTRVAQLMSYITKCFVEQKDHQPSSSNPDVAQLALIISDGRNVSSEGKETVRKAIRKARDENIFVIFIIVDNPMNKDSILDIRYAEFDEKNSLVHFDNYMDHFPFPFYLILRDLTSLPSVLSDALRQWFELVTSSER